jgi:hypothetical protein
MTENNWQFKSITFAGVEKIIDGLACGGLFISGPYFDDETGQNILWNITHINSGCRVALFPAVDIGQAIYTANKILAAGDWTFSGDRPPADKKAGLVGAVWAITNETALRFNGHEAEPAIRSTGNA